MVALQLGEYISISTTHPAVKFSTVALEQAMLKRKVQRRLLSSNNLLIS